MALADPHEGIGGEPAVIPSAIDPAGAVLTEQYAFKPRSKDYTIPGPMVGLPDCINLAVFDPPPADGNFAAISAKLDPNCQLPYHYHATGVMYFYTNGLTNVFGDTSEA